MVNVSCVQMHAELGDVEFNIEKMTGFVEEIMEQRPDTKLIVFPELAATGYPCAREQFQSMAESVPEGKSLRAMRSLAEKHGVTIVYGFAERDPYTPDVIYNSAAVVGSDGGVLGCYRKVHALDTEKLWCRAGCEYPVFDTEFGRIGVMICWDTAFPEVARTYALKGAELLVVCTSWEKPFSEDWDFVTKARAFDNVLPLAAANQVGDYEKVGFFGHSRILDAAGRELAVLDEEREGVIHAVVDLSEPLARRSGFYTFFKDRRPDTYGELVRQY